MAFCDFLWTLSCEIVILRRNSQHYRRNDALCRQNDMFYRQNRGPCRPLPKKRQHYRGFEHLGRWGPRSGRPGHRPPGKTRYFRNDLGSFPGREAGSVWETHNTIGESTSRMASGAMACGISGDAVWRIRNTHEDLASRPEAGPVTAHSRPRSPGLHAARRFCPTGP